MRSATQDTVTLIRSAIRALLKVAEGELALQLLALLERDDDYQSPGKPACDWDDEAAREALINDLARDAHALLAALDGLSLAEPRRDPKWNESLVISCDTVTAAAAHVSAARSASAKILRCWRPR